ncbi:MAG: Pre (Mob) type recombination enzyme [Alphaproteobacteria bacterium HGW-Alphaproteobacteria-1]|jgi:hypothetical protein|nr:MAG: Pre (Mob) type recombination enzyme [Alphaproteobacteria bacterium HGW-Alphaproteobacteria-1]
MPAKKHPIVLRFEGMSPRDLAGYEAHRLRKGGDLGHINRALSDLNERFIGAETWATEAQADIRAMTQEMYAAELAYHERRKDRKALEKRIAEGPRDPWRASRHGPLRELILTVNKDWFDADGDSNEMSDLEREARFMECAKTWLEDNFGDDVIHARADRDEQAFHVHAVIMPRTTVQKYGVNCRMLQPSIHPLIKDYEAAQDSVGQHFAQLGLTRGERRKQAIREALANGKAPPQMRRHVRPTKWRQMEELRLAQKEAEIEHKRRAVEDREREADDVIAFADAVAGGQLDETGREADDPERPPEAVKAFTPPRKSSTGFARARKAFARAFTRLRGKERQHAEAAAEARVASDLADIQAADAVIVEIAGQLPAGLRKRVGEIRRKLSARIMALDKGSRGSTKDRGADENFT